MYIFLTKLKILEPSMHILTQETKLDRKDCLIYMIESCTRL